MSTQHTTDGKGTDYLRFDHANVGYVIDGEEDATVRFRLEREFDEGEVVKLLTPGGNVFGLAEIEEVWTGPLRLVYHDMMVVDGRNHPADSMLDLHHRLEFHYPDDPPGPDDEVTVIYFDLLQVGGSTRQSRAVGGLP